jgi:hypothetical protein
MAKGQKKSSKEIRKPKKGAGLKPSTVSAAKDPVREAMKQ